MRPFVFFLFSGLVAALLAGEALALTSRRELCRARPERLAEAVREHCEDRRRCGYGMRHLPELPERRQCMETCQALFRERQALYCQREPASVEPDEPSEPTRRARRERGPEPVRRSPVRAAEPAPLPPSSPANPPCAGADCMGRAAEVDRRGTAQAARRARDFREADITAGRWGRDRLGLADRYLRAWEQSLQARAARGEGGGPIASERRRLESDRRLVESARARLARGEPLGREVAASARDEGVRHVLENLVEARELQGEYREEARRWDSFAAELGRLHAGNRANAEESASLVAGAAGSAPGGQREQEFSGKRAVGRTSGGDGADSSLALAREEGGARGAEEATEGRAPPARVPAAVGGEGRSLREQLRRTLRGPRTGEAGDQAGAGEIGPGSGDPAGRAAGGAAATALVEDFLRAAGKGPAFAMSIVDTDREVGRLVRETGEALGGDGGGWLEASSASLFARVRAAHRECERRGCVAGLSR